MEGEKPDVAQEEEKQREKDRLAKRLVFDVVSSVKGGSGKSTFSLLLAAHYNSTPGAVAYVLDLDLRGTSWEKNYGRYMTTPFFGDEGRNSLESYYRARFEELRDPSSAEGKVLNEDILTKRKYYRDYPFINSLMWNFADFQSKAFWSEIPFITASENGKISICPARTENGNDVDKIEVEIFEHIIHQLIRHIMDRHRGDKNIEEVHVVLDMPPSYEKHAEAVLKHLLINEESELFQLAKKRKDQFAVSPNDATRYYLPYEIRLFMLCARNPAHIEQNGVYLWHWLKKRKYSEAISDLVKDKKVEVKSLSDKKTSSVFGEIRRFLVCFVVNDISGNFWKSKMGQRDSSKSEFEQYADWAKLYFGKKEKEASSFYTQAKKIYSDLNPNLINYCAFPQINLPATYWELEAETAPSFPTILHIGDEKPNPLDYVKSILDNL